MVNRKVKGEKGNLRIEIANIGGGVLVPLGGVLT